MHNVVLYSLYCSPYNISDQIKEDEVGRTCSRHERDEIFIQKFGSEA